MQLCMFSKLCSVHTVDPSIGMKRNIILPIRWCQTHLSVHRIDEDTSMFLTMYTAGKLTFLRLVQCNANSTAG